MHILPIPQDDDGQIPGEASRLGDRALGEAAASLFYAAHDVLAGDFALVADCLAQALDMLRSAQAWSDTLEQRAAMGRTRH